MPTDLFTSVKRRLAGYNSHVERWKPDHDLAMRCMGFELLLQHGLSIYQAINWIDEAWRSRVYSKLVEYDPAVEKLVHSLYELWIAPSDFVLAEIERYEKDFTVFYADEFRAACAEVRGLLTDDAAFFSGGDLLAIRDLAIDAHRRGECEPCAE